MMSGVLKPLFCALLFGATMTVPATAGDTAKKLVVVELFTSQGCSSCPPADRFLGELAARGDILALTWDVNYWDYLGWRDTLARPENTVRQRAYNHALGETGVYTPQMIIDGRHDVVGSRRDDALASIARESKTKWAVSLTLTGSGDNRRVEIGAGAPKGPATVWLIGFDHARTVAIQSGELEGRTITYHNVVRDSEKLGQWTGEPVAFDIDMDTLRGEGRDGAAVLVQEDKAGPILGAIRLDVTPPE